MMDTQKINEALHEQINQGIDTLRQLYRDAPSELPEAIAAFRASAEECATSLVEALTKIGASDMVLAAQLFIETVRELLADWIQERIAPKDPDLCEAALMRVRSVFV